ncbi:TetR/AcrR family transcriptional regulator [Rhizobium sp. BE258]|uniref:TetR/AcrR family transcriptional regulator n=1 Tax=Rhizobium sp. BE258 TaxID=2817722 RepID=UPI0028621361|nr:TetR/AcrR family transcriptional regulator [Rhizobium sp. BE258]MDR7144993.1 TetR/AcrR family transcriptional repressor of nem operon [Rhizobium sp. BE258]
MTKDTRQLIMDTAKLTVQAHGYTALSFRELAKEIGIKNASVHYHFPTKGDLGAALAKQYSDDAQTFLSALSLEPSQAANTMRTYTDAFRAALERDNRMCLCGIMIAERDELPEMVRAEVDRFSESNINWLKVFLGALDLNRTDADTRAEAIFAAVEGAQLIARGYADIAVFDRCMNAYGQTGLFPAWKAR